MSPETKHNIFRVGLYIGIFLSIAYFFNLILDSNKKITYISMHELNTSNISKATILDGEKNLLVEDKGGKLFIVENFDKNTLERNGISYGYEHQTIDKIIKYALSIGLFVMVILLSIT
ncbi:MAG: hypothetical protein PHE67_10890 [Campylobacterales bacterium]|nr:hypothetical protein [Campylobacterales bacterium]